MASTYSPVAGLAIDPVRQANERLSIYTLGGIGDCQRCFISIAAGSKTATVTYDSGGTLTLEAAKLRPLSYYKGKKIVIPAAAADTPKVYIWPDVAPTTAEPGLPVNLIATITDVDADGKTATIDIAATNTVGSGVYYGVTKGVYGAVGTDNTDAFNKAQQFPGKLVYMTGGKARFLVCGQVDFLSAGGIKGDSRNSTTIIVGDNTGHCLRCATADTVRMEDFFIQGVGLPAGGTTLSFGGYDLMPWSGTNPTPYMDDTQNPDITKRPGYNAATGTTPYAVGSKRSWGWQNGINSFSIIKNVSIDTCWIGVKLYNAQFIDIQGLVISNPEYVGLWQGADVYMDLATGHWHNIIIGGTRGSSYTPTGATTASGNPVYNRDATTHIAIPDKTPENRDRPLYPASDMRTTFCRYANAGMSSTHNVHYTSAAPYPPQPWPGSNVPADDQLSPGVQGPTVNYGIILKAGTAPDYAFPYPGMAGDTADQHERGGVSDQAKFAHLWITNEPTTTDKPVAMGVSSMTFSDMHYGDNRGRGSTAHVLIDTPHINQITFNNINHVLGANCQGYVIGKVNVFNANIINFTGAFNYYNTTTNSAGTAVTKGTLIPFITDPDGANSKTFVIHKTVSNSVIDDWTAANVIYPDPLYDANFAKQDADLSVGLANGVGALAVVKRANPLRLLGGGQGVFDPGGGLDICSIGMHLEGPGLRLSRDSSPSNFMTNPVWHGHMRYGGQILGYSGTLPYGTVVSDTERANTLVLANFAGPIVIGASTGALFLAPSFKGLGIGQMPGCTFQTYQSEENPTISNWRLINKRPSVAWQGEFGVFNYGPSNQAVLFDCLYYTAGGSGGFGAADLTAAAVYKLGAFLTIQGPGTTSGTPNVLDPTTRAVFSFQQLWSIQLQTGDVEMVGDLYPKAVFASSGLHGVTLTLTQDIAARNAVLSGYISANNAAFTDLGTAVPSGGHFPVVSDSGGNLSAPSDFPVKSLVAGTYVTVSNSGGDWTVNANPPVTSLVAGTNVTVSSASGAWTVNATVPVTSLVAGTGITLTNSGGAWTIAASTAAGVDTVDIITTPQILLKFGTGSTASAVKLDINLGVRTAAPTAAHSGNIAASDTTVAQVAAHLDQVNSDVGLIFTWIAQLDSILQNRIWH